MAGFRAGRDRLQPFEAAELGDVNGKRLLHLQCHFGMDTLAWARRGALVTGADFSERAVARARQLAAELGIEASFVQSDIDELPDRLEGAFDIVYTGRGALSWLPSMRRWAGVIDHFLKPRGVFYMVEFHPINWTLEDVGVTEPVVRYPYFERAQPVRFEVQGSYADRSAQLRSKVEYYWPHGLGEIVTALCEHGLRLDFLHELPSTIYKQLPFLEQRDDGCWYLPRDFPGELPLMYSLRAVKARAG